MSNNTSHPTRGAALLEQHGPATRHPLSPASNHVVEVNTEVTPRQADESRRTATRPQWGNFDGTTWSKTVNRSRGQMLFKPPAIAFDAADVYAAKAHGIVRIVVFEESERKQYSTTLATLLTKAIELDRGHGRQVALPLRYWTITSDDDSPPVAAASVDPPDSLPTPAQLSLFKVGAYG